MNILFALRKYSLFLNITAFCVIEIYYLDQ